MVMQVFIYIKNAYPTKNNFIISQPKHAVGSQWDGSCEHPKHMLKLMGQKLLTILRSKLLFI